jgi:methylated-DNA-protein-cysteine methyltransferase-like protein
MQPETTSPVSTNAGHSVRERVHAIVAAIPLGRVTTYGDIARAAGIPNDARRVGWLVHDPPDELELPCHRIVNRAGELSGGWAFGHPAIMRSLLEAEGVTFVDEYRVDLATHRWTIEVAQPPPTK